MSYADYAIKRTNRLVDDEFEQAMLHKSSTVAVAYNDWLSLLIAAVLAWVLPGYYSLLCALPLFASSFAQLAGIRWLRRTVAIPCAHTRSLPELLIAAPLCIIATVGMAYKLHLLGESIITLLIGGLTGLIFTMYHYGTKQSEKRRRKDRQRLDKKLDSED
ncbi:hypothetical protein [Corynebacterium lowii]|uniref:Uncharacterized protein n=1 Tax=Corynebacterium lowii TaxID=1544413 RepID=A0A0Q0UJA7_9CORY|nr:hypothetical protein [Corynebacterium lowii]KQB86294.1 hypothetical protein Clow_01213 [Corynebacterium lowii]MDP9850779.1 hypothetical protein [Corynebacterium lowii]